MRDCYKRCRLFEQKRCWFKRPRSIVYGGRLSVSFWCDVILPDFLRQLLYRYRLPAEIFHRVI
jgi:hypothetical protein